MAAEQLGDRLLQVEVVARPVLPAALTEGRGVVVADPDRHEPRRDHAGERRGEAEARRVEAAEIFRAADVEAAVPRPSGTEAREQRRPQRRRQVDAQHVVPPVMVAARRRDFFAAPLGAGLAAPVVAVAEEEAVVVREVVIDARDAGRVGVEPRVPAREEVVAGGVRTRVRLHHVPQDVERHGVHPVLRNDVAGKRLRHAVDGVERVVDRHRRLREVARPLQIRRRTFTRRHRNARLQPLERVEEERPVAAVVLRKHDRPADAESGVVVEQVLLRDAAHGVLVEVAVERRVAMVVVRGAAQRVRSAADADGNHAAAGAPELRVVGVGADADFLHRVGRRHERQAPLRRALAARVGRAVEQQLVRSIAAAVDRDRIHAAVVERTRADARPRELRRHALDRVGERVGIAPGERQVLDLVLVDDLAARRGRRLEQRRLRHDPCLLGETADAERQVHAQAVAGAQLELPHDGGEPVQRAGQSIAAVDER